MIPSNSLSVLPWYESIDQQNAKKWWVYERIYPLFTPAGFLPPFQILKEHGGGTTIASFVLYQSNGQRIGDYTQNLRDSGLTIKTFSEIGIDVIVYPGILPFVNYLPNGQYYGVIFDGQKEWYSEVFTVVNDISPYLKIEWWDLSDFITDSWAIVYTDPLFKNVLYLQADIAKPEYSFEEEGETRDGFFFPFNQISEKRFKFNFLAPEYLLDVMRFVRMADFVQITKGSQIYNVDSFLITPNWESNGDVAVVEAEFTTDTVAKKIGLGYIKSHNGDFSEDFNNDFNND